MLRFFFITILASSVSAKMEGFIVGGHLTDIRKWPFIVFLTAEGGPPGDRVTSACGGSLLSSQTVLTAAHCTDDITQKHEKFDQFKFTVYMGHNEYANAQMMRQVKEYVAHEDYDPKDEEVKNDISIVLLQSPVRFSSTVKKVILVPAGSDAVADKRAVVAGWGLTEIDGTSSNTLKAAGQRLITMSDCNESLYGNVTGVICAKSAANFAYRGDSGGPLVRRSDSYQLGIISFRIQDTGVTVYSSVSYYYDWIRDNQKQLFTNYCRSLRRIK